MTHMCYSVLTLLSFEACAIINRGETSSLPNSFYILGNGTLSR